MKGALALAGLGLAHAGPAVRRLRPVLWTARTASVLAEPSPGLRGGATLLLHDSDHTSAPVGMAFGALPELVARVRARGTAARARNAYPK